MLECVFRTLQHGSTSSNLQSSQGTWTLSEMATGFGHMITWTLTSEFAVNEMVRLYERSASDHLVAYQHLPFKEIIPHTLVVKWSHTHTPQMLNTQNCRAAMHTYPKFILPDRHSTMTNLTSRLAINIRNLPDFTFSWSDCTPQRERSTLEIDDFIPSELDAAKLKERAVRYLMSFLVETFTSLQHLAEVIPAEEPLHPVAKVSSSTNENSFQRWKIQKCYHWDSDPASGGC